MLQNLRKLKTTTQISGVCPINTTSCLDTIGLGVAILLIIVTIDFHPPQGPPPHIPQLPGFKQVLSYYLHYNP